jgi:hypothetical protein
MFRKWAPASEKPMQSVLNGQPAQHMWPVVGNRCAPRDSRAVLEHQVEEGVDRVHAAARHADLAERFTHQRLVGAGHDLRVEEVAVPGSRAVLVVVVLAEPPPVFLVVQQFVALEFVPEVQGGGSGTELLEHHQIDAVGVHLERHGQMLEPEVAAEPVDDRRQCAGQPHRAPRRLHVRGRQQAGLQPGSPDAQGLECLRHDVLRVTDVGSGLQGTPGPA